MTLTSRPQPFIIRSMPIQPPGPRRRRPRCAHCGGPMHKRIPQQRFCSESCRVRAASIKEKGKRKTLTERRCIQCGNRLAESLRPQAKYCSAKCRKEAFDLRPCIYCGMPANSRDHFIPKSYVQMVQDLTHVKNVIVPACRECNSTAGNKVFSNIREKRAFIHECYKKKYAKLLNTPTWTEKEIEELGPTLRSHVKHGAYAKQLIRERLRWPRRSEGQRRVIP